MLFAADHLTHASSHGDVAIAITCDANRTPPPPPRPSFPHSNRFTRDRDSRPHPLRVPKHHPKANSTPFLTECCFESKSKATRDTLTRKLLLPFATRSPPGFVVMLVGTTAIKTLPPPGISTLFDFVRRIPSPSQMANFDFDDDGCRRIGDHARDNNHRIVHRGTMARE
uniref:Uncharacterized protein n=1 Tax=Panagrellus redivivus TaxID=6233 RepID=A0A7E4WBR7_PANRE